MIQRVRCRPRLIARTTVLLLGAAVLVAGGPAASAATSSGGSVTVGPKGIDLSGLEEITVSDIAPGYRELWSVRVVNDRSEAVTLGVRLGDLVDDDNGCSEPEAREDTTCGAGEGELGSYLEFAFGDADAQPSATVLAEAAEGAGEAVTVPAGGEADVVLGLHLPAGTGNIVQTDSVSFSLTWRAEAVPGGGGAVVENDVQVYSSAAGNGAGPGLPVSGAALFAFMGLAVALIAAGALLVLYVRDVAAGGRGVEAPAPR
ncbi:hypothetical protein [Nocardiopsis ansamitocini]|uniref:Uncharacterized protein n=1 Tax=Nocardiopsis ansamitocini TaxID=1670832 RepID=A0A9W6P4V7_9ACTN|nr:hypothetical protein [Nocardiopsis ansamitocini]GLU47142.1 hypothetical protein Nans01_14930 [Nocardiopsis ansamitocini]